jgi:YHS domain-containing protein
MVTRNNIYKDLQSSPFKIILEGVIYHFSSLLHLQKFVSRYPKNRRSMTEYLAKLYNVNLSLHRLPDLILYRKIETRGFFIKLEGSELKCLDSVIFMEKILIRPSIEQSKIITLN